MTVQKNPAKNGPTYAFLTSHIVKNAARYALKKSPLAPSLVAITVWKVAFDILQKWDSFI